MLFSSLIRGLGVLVVVGSVFVSDALTVTFSNLNPITMNDSMAPPTKAGPYPSAISVTGLTSQAVVKVAVQLYGFSHTYPDDVDIILVGPDGTNSVVMSNVGGGHPGATNISLTLDDSAADYLPLHGPFVSGTFKPTKRLDFLFSFPTPAPPSPGGPSLSLFNGSNPNGTWSLFIVDDASPDSGMIWGGWSLTITTAPVMLSINQRGTNVVVSWTNLLSSFSLQTAPNFSSAWTNALPLPTLVSGQYNVTNSVSASTQRVYRLMK